MERMEQSVHKGDPERMLSEWPDWNGQIAAIIASGPSAKTTDISQLRGRARVIAIKENIDLCPWADAVYGCDAPWWVNRRGLPEFTGLKLSYAPINHSVRQVSIPNKKLDCFLFDKIGTIGSGGNSGFQAVNLAMQFGSRRILLVGFDMHDRSGTHWYGRATGMGRNNPDENNFRRWRQAFDNQATALVRRGIEVVNTSPISALTCFPKQSIADALARWQ